MYKIYFCLIFSNLLFSSELEDFGKINILYEVFKNDLKSHEIMIMITNNSNVDFLDWSLSFSLPNGAIISDCVGCELISKENGYFTFEKHSMRSCLFAEYTPMIFYFDTDSSHIPDQFILTGKWANSSTTIKLTIQNRKNLLSSSIGLLNAIDVKPLNKYFKSEIICFKHAWEICESNADIIVLFEHCLHKIATQENKQNIVDQIRAIKFFIYYSGFLDYIKAELLDKVESIIKKLNEK